MIPAYFSPLFKTLVLNPTWLTYIIFLLSSLSVQTTFQVGQVVYLFVVPATPLVAYSTHLHTNIKELEAQEKQI